MLVGLVFIRMGSGLSGGIPDSVEAAKAAGYSEAEIEAYVAAKEGQRCKACIVDCGSCASRGETFSVRDDGLIYSESKFRLPALDEMLRSASASEASEEATIVQEWIDALVAEVDDATSDVVIGATGGLREALDEGAVSDRTVASFRGALEAAFGPRAHFQVLSGSDEASAERGRNSGGQPE